MKHTHTQIWGKDKRSLKGNRNVGVGKHHCIKSPWINEVTAHKQPALTFNDCHSN